MATSPKYYTRGSIEVWDFIRDQKLNYHLGNAIKYICRAGYKGCSSTDLSKAIHYLQNELDYAGGGVPHGLQLQQQYEEPYDAAQFDR